MTTIRLNKLLATRGIGARRKCDTLIESGAVSVNGEVVTAPGTRVVEDRDRVTVNGRPLPERARFRYLALHKPVGVITTLSDPEGRPTIREMLPPGGRLFPVGRLDADTSGLLVVTNDGDLAHHLMHPRYGLTKFYRVLVEREPDDSQLKRLAEGVEFEPGIRSAPARVRRRDPVPRGAVIEIALHEGRHRQVRRMCEAVGLRVLGLHRWAYGPLRLGELERGMWRDLSDQEVSQLRSSSARPQPRPEAVRRSGGSAQRRQAESRSRGALERVHGAPPAVRSRTHDAPRAEARSRSEASPRLDSRPRAEARPRRDSRPRFDSRPRTDARPRSDVRTRPDSRPRSETRPRFNARPRTDARPRSDVRTRPDARSRSDSRPFAGARPRADVRSRSASRTPPRRFASDATRPPRFTPRPERGASRLRPGKFAGRTDRGARPTSRVWTRPGSVRPNPRPAPRAGAGARRGGDRSERPFQFTRTHPVESGGRARRESGPLPRRGVSRDRAPRSMDRATRRSENAQGFRGGPGRERRPGMASSRDRAWSPSARPGAVRKGAPRASRPRPAAGQSRPLGRRTR